MKKWIVFTSVLTLALVIAACGANSGDSGNSPAIEANAGDGSGIIITASNWEFDQEQYTIKAGEPVQLTVKSIEGMHGIQIMKTDYKRIPNNKPTTVQIDEPGTYDIICNISCGKGHAQMRAKLVVE